MNRRHESPETNNATAVLLTDQAAAARYNIGVTNMRKLAKQADAIVMLGRCRRNDVRKLDRFFGLTA